MRIEETSEGGRGRDGALRFVVIATVRTSGAEITGGGERGFSTGVEFEDGGTSERTDFSGDSGGEGTTGMGGIGFPPRSSSF